MLKKAALVLSLFAAVLPPSFALSADLQNGKVIYEARCSWCHGKDGAGDGPAASFLMPAPRDFTSAVYKWKSTPFDEIAPSDDDLRRMTAGTPSHDGIPGWTGMNGTSMPGWADMLSKRDLEDISAYIKSISRLSAPEKPSVSLANPAKATKEGMEKGGRLFKDRCSECHGEAGRGDAAKKLKDDFGGRTWPRDLTKNWTFRAGSGTADIYTRITVGIPGTQMPSFADPKSRKKLSEEERWDVANYVAALNEPYKRPGGDDVINALRITGPLPGKPEDPAWGGVEYANFYMAPQIIAGDKSFKPSIDSISVKALYNDKEVALLLEWGDPTRSAPGEPKSIEIADGEVFEDAAAVEFPLNAKDRERPYFGMGGAASPVEIWLWKSAQSASQTVKLLTSRGFDNITARDAPSSGLTASGVYDRGTWRVVMKRPLYAGGSDTGFEEGSFIPIAFAAWDGSNGDKGGRHVMTSWHWLHLGHEPGAGVYIWPAAVAVLTFAGLLYWSNRLKGK